MQTVTGKDLESSYGKRKVIAQLSGALSQGQIIIAPVAQGYAYLGDGRSGSAISQIREIKGFDAGIPLVTLVANYKQVEQYCGSLTSEQIRVIKKFWPGALIIERETQSHLRYSFGSRILPDRLMFTEATNSIVKALCRKVGPLGFSPIMANGELGREVITDITALTNESTEKVSHLLSATTESWSQLKSTWLLFEGGEVKIRRIGEISEASIREIIPRAKLDLR